MDESKQLKNADFSYGVIYLITNNINGKVYIGQTTSDIPKSRWNGHIYCARHNVATYYFGNAIKKYGADNFTFEIIKNCTDQEDLNYWEKYYIDYYDSRNRKKGYNTKEGGSHGKHSEETKEKLRKINIGKILSDEHKLKLSLAHLGKTHSKEGKEAMSKIMTGRKLSSKHCELISIGKKGKKFTEEHRKNIAISKSGEKSPKAKLNWDMVNKIRKEYKKRKTTLIKLSKKYNICESSMRRVVFNYTWIDKNYASIAEKIKERNKKPSGERNSQAKLTWKMVRAIRAESKANPEISYTKLGEKYNISRVSVSLILKNKTWIDD